jgi:uncharacterized protein (TIGR00369 family)
MSLTYENKCFVCGTENRNGLRLSFNIDKIEKTLRTTFVPSETYQGWDGIVHGGILSTLLDEAVAKLAYELGFEALTARLTVTFRKAAKIGKQLAVFGEITRVTPRIIEGASRITDTSQNLIAEGEVRLLRVPRLPVS